MGPAVAVVVVAVVAVVRVVRLSVVRVVALVVLAAQEGRLAAAVAWAAGVSATPVLLRAAHLACPTRLPRSSTQGMVVVAAVAAGPRWLTRSHRRWASSPSIRRTFQHSVAAGRVGAGFSPRCRLTCRLRLGPRRAGGTVRHWEAAAVVPLVPLLGRAPLPVEVGCMALRTGTQATAMASLAAGLEWVAPLGWASAPWASETLLTPYLAWELCTHHRT